MKKWLIIMGSAPCLEEDLENIKLEIGYLREIDEIFDFMAIGLDCADRYLGRIEHCATYHPIDFTDFRKRRAVAGANLDYITHSHEILKTDSAGVEIEQAQHIWPYQAPSGSSVMLGVEVAISLGYKKIIVAGCLLTGKNRKGFSYSEFREGWNRRFETIKYKVRAMSGFPRELLGGPTEEWLSSFCHSREGGNPGDIGANPENAKPETPKFVSFLEGMYQ